jgi:hypothetical protein
MGNIHVAMTPIEDVTAAQAPIAEPWGAVLLRDDEDSVAFSFEDLPDLTDVRRELRSLREDIG